MRTTKLMLATLALLGACGRSPIQTAPAPSAAVVPGVGRQPAADPTPAPVPPIAGPSAPAAADSPRVTQSGTRDEASATSTVTVATTPGVSDREVSQRVEGLFGAIPAAPVHADSAAEEAGPTWDIDVRSYETTEQVAKYVRMFTGASRERIQARLERGTRYEPMIRARMRAGGLPEDMYYLALIESGFDPNAYSRAAAVGMWQFMASTGRDMGMRVDWWVDERRDPVKSTGAAVRFIRGLEQQFGSLYLAAAAYNGGPGRISRGLSRYADDLEGTSGDDLFFALADKDYLRSETKEYVPQLIAAALIAKEPAKYGMELHPLPAFTYDSVAVPASTPLAAVAKAAGATVAQLHELNPQILRGMTPPRVAYQLRIPPGSRARYDSAFATLSREELTGYKVVATKKGEQLEDFAYRVHSSVRALTGFNQKIERSRKTGRLVPGQELRVPSPAVAAAMVNVPDPSIEKWGGRSTTTHVVKHGESLGLIAKRYHTDVKSLMRLNGLRRPMIFPGQELLVAGRARPASRRPAASSHKGKGSARAPARAAARKAASTGTAKKKSAAR